MELNKHLDNQMELSRKYVLFRIFFGWLYRFKENKYFKHLQVEFGKCKYLLNCFFRWKESYLEMTEKLKKRLEGMQKENDELRARLNVASQENSSSTAQYYVLQNGMATRCVPIISCFVFVDRHARWSWNRDDYVINSLSIPPFEKCQSM